MSPEEQRKKVLLQRWLSGAADFQEEQELRRLASGTDADPFLAEAIQGFDAHPQHDHDAALQDLRKQLPTRQKRKRPALVYWQRAVAAALLLLLGSAAIWYLNQPSDSIAELTPTRQETPTKAAEATPLEQETIVEESEVLEEETISESVPEKSSTSPPPPPPPPAVREPIDDEAENTAAAESIEDAYIAAKEELEEAEPIAKLAQKDIANYSIEVPKVAAPSAAATANPIRVINGRVTDENGESLIGATILLPNTKKGTISDFNGNYSLQVPNDYSGLVQVSYTGYQQAIFDVEDTNSYQVVLNNTGVALDEVVVTDLGVSERTNAQNSKKRSKVDNAFDDDPPQPVNGFIAYKEYVKQNIDLTITFMQKISGPVELEFTISPNGTPSDFKVLKSLCKACDEEAIRIVEQGPKWTPRGRTTTYTIRF